MVLNGASRDSTSSSIVSHFCLMAKASKVSPTLNPNISCDDIDDGKVMMMLIMMKRIIMLPP